MTCGNPVLFCSSSTSPNSYWGRDARCRHKVLKKQIRYLLKVGIEPSLQVQFKGSLTGEPELCCIRILGHAPHGCTNESRPMHGHKPTRRHNPCTQCGKIEENDLKLFFSLLAPCDNIEGSLSETSNFFTATTRRNAHAVIAAVSVHKYATRGFPMSRNHNRKTGNDSNLLYIICGIEKSSKPRKKQNLDRERRAANQNN